MKPHILVSALVAVADIALAKDQRSFAVLRFTNKQLTKGRMDPIRNPGQAGAHVHNILGGSGFGLSSNGHDLTKSKCSTAKVKGDNSNYWFPSLYFKDPKTGKYEDVEIFYANAYYFFEATNDDIKAFPLGLSIVSGDIDTRSAPAGGAVTNLDASKGPINPVKWTCPRDGNNYSPPSWPAGSDGKLAGIGDPINKGEGVGFPDVNCDGFASPLRADIHFPSCYDPAVGLTDYKKNMAFPSAAGDGKMDCPKGHIHVPHLFLEVYWNTPAFKDRWEQGKGSQPFVLSNGDATGFSLHADFMAGWDEKVLQHIIDTCDAGTIGMDKCPGLPYGLNEADCTIESAINEKVDGVLDSLPGSNRLAGWAYGAGGKPSDGGGTAPTTSASYGEPTTSASYGEPTRAGSDSEYPSPEPASSSLQAARYKLPVNGLVGASTVSPTKEPVSSPTGIRYHVPSRGLPKHYTNSTIIRESTRLDSVGSAVMPTASSSPLYPVADSVRESTVERQSCITKTKTVQETVTVTRKAPMAAMTGGPYANSTVSGYKYAGCFQDATIRALSGVIRADVGVVSNAKCVDYCRAAGHGLAGTEYGGQCYCGNDLFGSKKLDEAQCDMTCEGDRSALCGGSWALSVYSRDGRASIRTTGASNNATVVATSKSRRHFHDHVRRPRSLHH
ncbi:hypothetical protein XA68_16570 [Ophiocordyceps unilateralis]|uniref:WSC domain-containing protein n=1 Tax=Ophiocordyceps unilateralis TaxID=268505 RepID=A0A2A9PLA7_OPHUN|nr:hypothetical protein XA68_16570 [Ophiocordyceps unilateralis]